MRMTPFALTIITAITPHFANAESAPSAEKLMEDSDRARGGLAEGLTWEVSLESIDNDVKSARAYLVRGKGDNAYVETTAPARNKGEVILFNDRTLWFFKAGLKKPVSISARQRLSGQAANGDIASTNYRRDYTATIAGEETLSGVATWKLDLVAKEKNVTYDKIRYWVSKEKHQALKAEFLTVRGQVFKSALFKYGNSAEVKGTSFDFVRTMTIQDAKFPKNITTLSYGKPKPEPHPDSIFNVNNLLR